MPAGNRRRRRDHWPRRQFITGAPKSAGCEFNSSGVGPGRRAISAAFRLPDRSSCHSRPAFLEKTSHGQSPESARCHEPALTHQFCNSMTMGSLLCAFRTLEKCMSAWNFRPSHHYSWLHLKTNALYTGTENLRSNPNRDKACAFVWTIDLLFNQSTNSVSVSRTPYNAARDIPTMSPQSQSLHGFFTLACMMHWKTLYTSKGRMLHKSSLT